MVVRDGNRASTLHWLDGLVIVISLLDVTALGIWSGRRVHRPEDYFIQGRFGMWMLIMHAFGTGTESDQAVTVASATARNGLSGIWFQWFRLMTTSFYGLIAPIMRRFRTTNCRLPLFIQKTNHWLTARKTPIADSALIGRVISRTAVSELNSPTGSHTFKSCDCWSS